APPYPQVIVWKVLDRGRVTLVPPNHWLLVQDESPFRASLQFKQAESPLVENVESIPAQGGHFACFAPRTTVGLAGLFLERYAKTGRHVEAALQFVPEPNEALVPLRPQPTARMLLTNGRGGMARLSVDLGRVLSKYDCVLGANLHPNLPVDRH